MRAFVAVELPEELRIRIAEAAAVLLRDVPAARPIPVQSLHVTMQFLGEVAESRVNSILAALESAAATQEASSCELRGFGAFPDARRPRVVWTGIRDPERRLASLEQAISTRLSALGFAREERPFSAHVTVARMKDRIRDLGRLRERLDAAAGDPVSFGSFQVLALTLFRSEPSKSGSRYTALGRAALTRNPS